jgi:hypothetical protein
LPNSKLAVSLSKHLIKTIMKNLTRKFILENPTMTLAQAFSELFTVELVQGTFYTKRVAEYSDPIIFLFNGELDRSGFALGWGIDAGGSFRNEVEGGWGAEGCVKAKHEEVEAALIKIAKTKGYADRNYDCLALPEYTHSTDGEFYLDKLTNRLHHGLDGRSNIVMMNGQWATIRRIITIADAEAELNARII